MLVIPNRKPLSRTLLLMNLKTCILSLILLNNSSALLAQTTPLNPLIEDVNLDGRVEFLAFGDSITRGVGDDIGVGEDVIAVSEAPSGEAGYPRRLEDILGIPVSNKGIPGERISSSGVFRFTTVLKSTNSDYVLISEGANDSFDGVAAVDLGKDIQTMINISKSLNKEVILVGIPPSCCRHGGTGNFVKQYNQKYADLADLNNIQYSDTERAWGNTCDTEECYLLNLPEGLHPNTEGYDSMAEVIIATLYGIDIYSPGGAALLAQALGVPESSLATKSPPGLATPSTISSQ